MRDRGIVKCPYLLRGAAFEANGAAVGIRRFFTVYRFAHAKRISFMTVEQPGVARGSLVPKRFTHPERAEDGVIKPPGPFDVIRTDSYMTEHNLPFRLTAVN
jgi:hypothetical protein